MQDILAIVHVAFEDLGTLGQELDRRGAAVNSVDACSADLRAIDAAAPDLLIILGGPIGVYETEAYPFLTDEIELIRRRLAARRPTLGVCLGAQLIASALGAAVYPGSQGKEIGWAPALPESDMDQDSAFAQLLADAPSFFHFHGDTFDLPHGARRLARTKKYANQAFAVEDYALGIQFHPEVTAEGLEQWFVGHACELAAAKIDISELRRTSHALAPQLEPAATRFWRSWLKQITA